MSTDEIELKFLVRSKATLDAIASSERIGDYVVEPLATQTLRTVYLDTVEGNLQRARIAFRIRTAGRDVEASIKSGGGVEGDVHRRRELTVPLDRRPRFPFRPPQGPLRDAIANVIGERALEPVVETRVVRRRLLARREGAAEAVAEIDLDEVEFRVPQRSQPRSKRRELEVEIEVRAGGSENDLERIAEILRREHRLDPSPRSKLERALAWAGRRGTREVTSRRT